MWIIIFPEGLFYFEKEDKMNENERQEFIKNEMGAIYEEFCDALNQIMILKPFIKQLVDVANGINYNLDNVIEIRSKIQK